MIDIATVSLSVSGIVALIQVANFFENRRTKADNKLEQFAKADELIDVKKHSNNMHVGLIRRATEQDKKIAVLEERLNNEIHNTGKQLDKVLSKLDDIK